MNAEEMPKPILDPNTVYVVGQRYCCGLLKHAGMSAAFTGRTIHGVKVKKAPKGATCEGCEYEKRQAKGA